MIIDPIEHICLLKKKFLESGKHKLSDSVDIDLMNLGFESCKTILEYNQCFVFVYDYFEEKQWTVKYISELEKIIKTGDGYRVLGEISFFIGKNKEKCRDYFKCAYEKGLNETGNILLAKSVIDMLGDKQWASQIYQSIINRDGESIGIAESVAVYLDDIDWSKKIYEKIAAFRCYHYDDYKKLLYSISEHIKENRWARPFFEKAVVLLKNARQYFDFINLVDFYFSDRQWCIDLLKKCESKISNADFALRYSSEIAHYTEDIMNGIHFLIDKNYTNLLDCFVLGVALEYNIKTMNYGKGIKLLEDVGFGYLKDEYQTECQYRLGSNSNYIFDIGIDRILESDLFLGEIIEQ